MMVNVTPKHVGEILCNE